MDKKQLQELQGLDLKYKIMISKQRIQEWYEEHDGMVYVSFSGGKDSTVLLHLVRSMYPDVPALFADTGLEYPEIREFVKRIDNVAWVRPKKNFKQVIEQNGYPVISKKTAKSLRRLQNPSEKNAKSRHLALTGITSDGRVSKHFKLAEKWKPLIDAPFKISEQCCDIMKKEPIHRYERETKRRAFVGTMASDSMQRESAYLATGCNNFSKKGLSTPLGFWKEDDIWEYIKEFDIPYSKIYDMGAKRTGCIFCLFGVHMEKEPNRFQRMQIQHPQLWEYCIYKLGLGEVLDYINVPYMNNVDVMKDTEGVSYQQFKIV